MPWRDNFQSFSRHHSLPKELRQFFYGIFFYRFGAGLISLAGPLFLFRIGQEFAWFQNLPLDPLSKGIFFVLIFFLLERFIILLTTFHMAKIIPRLGFHWGMVIGLILLAIRVGLYDLFLHYPTTFLLSVVVSAFGAQFFWLSYHTYFTMEAHVTKLESEVGGIEFLTRLSQVLAPLIGALLAGKLGFVIALWAGVLFYGVAILFLLTLPHLHTKLQWHWRDFTDWLRDKHWRRTALALAAFTWEELGIIVFWPIFLFITFNHIESVGYILSTASFLSLLFIYLSGWIFDHRKKHSTMIQKASGAVLSLLWIPRLIFSTSPVTLVLNDALDRLTVSIYNTLFTASILFTARGKHMFIFYVNRQVAISLLWILLLALSLGLLFVQWNWTVLFASFLLAGLVSLLFTRKK